MIWPFLTATVLRLECVDHHHRRVSPLEVGRLHKMKANLNKNTLFSIKLKHQIRFKTLLNLRKLNYDQVSAFR